MLLFQRRKDFLNTESCGTNINTFLNNSCGDISNLSTTNSYSADVDEIFGDFSYDEYLFTQYDTNDILDSDDAYIIKSKESLFPNIL
jgi:hypothetical protein